MKILSGIFKSRDKLNTDNTAGNGHQFLFGGSTSGKVMYCTNAGIHNFANIFVYGGAEIVNI
ncbi:hypothetical protein CLVI_10010 [Clostridium vincentii]|uniref:Uncharacterized protein n=1 Tax=Clostridium vincentii TaxID=52704 RepID=A0A2T0BI25_9CLOT|nr:hypothetical protein CLVI_10010 [Clostridium vincentii]